MLVKILGSESFDVQAEELKSMQDILIMKYILCLFSNPFKSLPVKLLTTFMYYH